MPIYLYEHTEAPGPGCSERFEELESLTAKPYARCPDCGRPVRRIPAGFTAPENKLAPSRLKEHGFQTLRKRNDGSYGE